MDVTIEALAPGDAGWDELLDVADACPWRGARSLARKMREGYFAGWQRVVAARVDGALAGFCALVAEDGLVDGDPSWTPWVAYVYVDEARRGHRLGARMVDVAAARAAEAGFGMLYVRTGEDGLYERMGFSAIGRAHDRHGNLETVLARPLA